MAQIIIALLLFTARTGELPYFDIVQDTVIHFCTQMFLWICYFGSFSGLMFLNGSTTILEPIVSWIAYFWMDFDRGPNRYQQRHQSQIPVFYAIDVRHVILSEYQLNACWAFYLNSNFRYFLWFSSYIKAVNRGYDYLFMPTRWFMQHSVPWPPDGPILHLFFTMALCLFHVYLFISSSSRIIRYRLKKWSLSQWRNLVQSSRSLAQSVYSWCLGCTQRRGSRSLITSSVYNISLQVNTAYACSAEEDHDDAAAVSWEPGSISTVLDNSANTHVWNRLEDFVEGSLHYFDDTDSVGVLTIGDESTRPLGTGLVKVELTDDNGMARPLELQQALFFPASPVRIISVTKLASQFDDENGTWIKTYWRRSVFCWDRGKYSLTFVHPPSTLPVVHVQVPGPDHASLCTLFENAGVTSTSDTALATCRTYLPTDRYDDICLVTDEIQSAQGDPRYRFQLQANLESGFKVGDRLRYTKDSYAEAVDVVNVRIEDMVPYYTVALKDGHSVEVTKEFLSPLTDDDVAIIPITKEQVQNHIDRLEPDDVEALLNPGILTEEEKEVYAWHHRLGHLPFRSMIPLCERGYLPRRFKSILENKKLRCPSCIFGKCKKRPWRTRGMPGRIQGPSETEPGDRVSVDHVISAQPGLVPRMDGRHTKERINSVCVFIDHVSKLTYSHMQTSANNEQTVAAKLAFEQFAESNNVKVKSYHADNGIFAEQAFRDEVETSNQSITYCAVGAHHQNGIVERLIMELTYGARTNLLHAQRRWPKAVGTILWPFAWKDFERRYNELRLDEDGRSALNRFSGSDVRSDLRDFHPFGCPVFVLEESLQGHIGSVPKWDPRARVGVYLGRSPSHASSVALVLNPRTLHVSPQFHVVFDDEFSTVPFMLNGEVPPHWSDLVKRSAELVTDEEFNLATTWAQNFIGGKSTSIDEEDETVDGSDIVLNQVRKVRFVDEVEEADYHDETAEDTDTTEFVLDELVPETAVPEEEKSPETDKAEEANQSLLMPEVPSLNDVSCRRSRRTKTKSRAAKECTDRGISKLFVQFVACTALVLSSTAFAVYSVNKHKSSVVQKIALHTEKVNMHFDRTINKIHHAALATADDNDTYTLKDMLKQEDKAEFIQAMVKEVADHEKRDHWTVMPRSEMPKGTKTILSVWSFKRKRYPDGRILKHKARLCAHGGMQTWGVNYWETYAPVVNWLSVRTLMTLSVLHDLETRSIDFVLAFPQADLDVDIYMELPYGFDFDGRRNYILKLNKNLYGLCDASRTFWKMLKQGLELRGYEKQSTTDACVFLGKDSIVLIYVDDCIVIQKKGSSAADDLIRHLQEGKEAFAFTDDGSLDKYLGVDVKKLGNGSIELTQTHLIQRFLDVVGIDDKVNPRPTPAIKPLLYKDLEGLPRKCEWNYRKAIGMLNYLTGTTRPDIAMAVHQAARFTNEPRLSHERAVLRIGKYLQGTKERGIIFKPDSSRGLECHVDADFAGGWNKADANSADAVMSRTGYIISYAGCPLIWCSRLQTEIALSTVEAEYLALSQSLREVIPLMQLLREINLIFPIHTPTPEIHCKVWEDNEGALSLAKNGRFSPRTKHIAIKYHHFRQHVDNGFISIHSIDTKEQTADIFTKPLDESLFVHLRKKLCGW